MPIAASRCARFLLCACLALVARPWPQSVVAGESLHHWFSVSIDVSGLPADADGVPVQCPIDFSALLERLKVPGAVDERSLRLERISPDGRAEELPFQFTAHPQPGARSRRRLANTVPEVSYLAEYAAGETPEVKVAGTLAWFAQADAKGAEHCRLRFGVPRAGRMIQTPFPPQNLRAFDDQGRGTPVRWFPRMQIRPSWPLEGAVHVTDRGALVTTYHIGPTSEPVPAGSAFQTRRPFLYPVNGPDGVGLTDFGKPHDPTGSHAHHHSIWIAHANVAGRDFWSQQGGVIVHGRLEDVEDGPVYCRWTQTARWMFQGEAMLSERRTITVFAATTACRLMDFDLQFAPPGPNAVQLGKTTFGFLAVRVAQSMTPFDGGGEILNSQGDRNEQAAHLRRARWLDQSGPISGDLGPQGPSVRWGGIAMLDHPENPNHPTGWHCRNDGWAGAAFTMDGPYTIGAGGILRLRYRLVLHSHDARQADVARRFDQYAARPVFRIGEPSAAD